MNGTPEDLAALELPGVLGDISEFVVVGLATAPLLPSWVVDSPRGMTSVLVLSVSAIYVPRTSHEGFATAALTYTFDILAHLTSSCIVVSQVYDERSLLSVGGERGF